MLLIVSVVDPLFFRVTAFCAPLFPTATAAHDREVGLTDALPPDPPVAPPERETFCGLVPSESLKFKVAVRVPLAVGANKTFTVQLADAASEVPHVLLKIWKSPALVPLTVMPLIESVVAFPFVNVTTFCAPLFPTATDAQLRLVGETVAAAKPFVADARSTSAAIEKMAARAAM
jgi:hypothetical protein